MSYCGGLQYYCKLGATSQAVHICYVSRHTQHANLDSNSVSFDVPAGQVVSGGREKHPVYKTVRKKILKSLLGSISFQKRGIDKKVEPSCISSFLLFLFFFQEERAHVSCFM
uniref:Uncharacterized protein n=1 Tax=Aquila chrysaetos chrysaetos TaxID=223781 RepID=A0A663DWU2_AQUCH